MVNAFKCPNCQQVLEVNDDGDIEDHSCWSVSSYEAEDLKGARNLLKMAQKSDKEPINMYYPRRRLEKAQMNTSTITELAKSLGVHLLTKAYTTGEDYYAATLPLPDGTAKRHVGPDFTGTRVEMIAFLHGYKEAHDNARLRSNALHEKIARVFSTHFSEIDHE